MKPAPPVMRRAFKARSDRRALGILKGQSELLGQRIDGRPAALPRAIGFEAQIADPSAPRRDHTANGAEIRAIRVLLIEPACDVAGNTDERPQGSRRFDAVLASVPGAAEH